MKTKRRPRLAPIPWIEGQPLTCGCRQWFSRDGMFRLICSDTYDGIELPRLWKLYQWRRGSWWKVAEKRSRQRIERLARQRAVELNEE